MTDEAYDRWRDTGKQRVDWEQTFRAGRWEYLTEVGELPRYALLAGYVHRLLGSGHVLDAGCGDGVLLDYLDLERFDYTGFDGSPTAVGHARERLRRATLVEATIEEFEPPGGVAYDAIVFSESVQHSETPLESIARYRGFLSARGLIVVSLFKNPNEHANGPRFEHFLTEELARGTYALVDRTEAVSASHGRRWDVLVFR